MRTRPASDDDWAGIWPIWHGQVSAGDLLMWRPDTSEADARKLWMLPPPAAVLVMEDDAGDGRIVASAQITPAQAGLGDHVAQLIFIAEPARIAEGLEREMAQAAIEHATELGYRAMQSTAVVAGNTRMVAIWRVLAFRVIGTLPSAFRHPQGGDIDLYVMHRFLPYKTYRPRRLD
ncbi:N-acetyltransferase [Pseudofrankia sp. BMG5.37]|nr:MULTISPECIES: GNAT family N-acetyltransferase [unclassified Pseudofrankia]MDT3439685.1 N-acetyltransferase [Pseudofrankia sp. BMG5.37]OHV42871.1 acetyltransferase [Pseudofrankia sp. BMG5.36]